MGTRPQQIVRTLGPLRASAAPTPPGECAQEEGPDGVGVGFWNKESKWPSACPS